MLWINSYVPIKCWDLFRGEGIQTTVCPWSYARTVLLTCHPSPPPLSHPTTSCSLPSGYFSISEPAPGHWTHRHFVVWCHRQPRIPSTNLWEKCKPLPTHPCCPCPAVIACSQQMATQSNWLPWHPFATQYQGTESSWASLTKEQHKEPKVQLEIVLSYYYLILICVLAKECFFNRGT